MTPPTATALAAAISALVALSAGCAPCPDDPTDKLTVEGELPACMDSVIAAAQARCDRPIVGTIIMTDDELSGGRAGYCAMDNRSCPLHAWVWRRFTADLRFPPGAATELMVAHEIGHYCLWTKDEAAVKAWAADVNHEAWRECSTRP